MNIPNMRISFIGYSPEIMTLGLLSVRRDLNLIGIHSGISDIEQAKSLDERERICLHSTLFLGCPVFSSLKEMIDNSDIVIASSDIQFPNNDIPLDKCVFIKSECHTPQNTDIAKFNHTYTYNLHNKKMTFYGNDSDAMTDIRKYLTYINSNVRSDNDAGELTWEQAFSIVQGLYAEKVNA